MSNFPSSSNNTIPSIHINGTDDASALFNGDLLDMNVFLEDPALYSCSQSFQSDYVTPDSEVLAELEEIPELSHLPTTSQQFLTDFGISLPYSAILQENTCNERRLAPLGSPLPSPTPSFGSSLSPASCYDPLAFSDSDSLISPSADTADARFPWPSQMSSESLVSQTGYIPVDSFSPSSPSQSGVGPHRIRSQSSPPRPGPVASKAMLEANGRRRRHPPQFECVECRQTFTALFSLKRHQQSHTGERPFECSIPGCSQRFYNSSDCKRHEKSKKRHKDLL